MNKKDKYIPIIGLEVHVELKTKSKMFCQCPAEHFQVKANTHTCPVCLGLPGALPVPNQQAIEWTIFLGQALNCQIADFSKFDRKNYFYPDLAKGYQVSQYDLPFAREGLFKFKMQNEKSKTVRINRVHLEEDTAKLIHRGDSSLIDFNRSGVPLVEIVTEPDINSAQEAIAYLKKTQQIVRYLGISDADMEKGSMRLEPNISLSTNKDKLPEYKVEIKNINSFKLAQKAIDYEIKRQQALLEKGQQPIQETRGFDEKNLKTYLQRTKEGAADYRYFPEPDIPPIKMQSLKIKRPDLPELPEDKQARFEKEYNLKAKQAEILTKTRKTADYYEQLVRQGKKQNLTSEKLANILINKPVNINKTQPGQLIKDIASQQASQVTSQDQIADWVKQVIKDNPQPVQDFKQGKQAAIAFLIGQVMKLSKGTADPNLTQKLLVSLLG